MCDPVQIALAAAQTFMSQQEQKAQANALAAQQARQAEAAEAAYNQDVKIIERRKQEEIRAAAQAQEDVYRDALQKTATARVAAGEAGVAGLSVDSLLRDISFQEGTVQTRNVGTLRNTVGALEDDKTRAYSNMVSRFNSMSPIAQPNFIGTSLQVAGNYATEANITKLNEMIS